MAEGKPGEKAGPADLGAWRVRLTGSASHGSHRAEATANAVDDDGLSLTGCAGGDLGPYAWVAVEIPGHGSVQALGELQPGDPARLALEVKFKHLFPDQRRRWLRAIAAD
jgi:hypothetical protein